VAHRPQTPTATQRGSQRANVPNAGALATGGASAKRGERHGRSPRGPALTRVAVPVGETAGAARSGRPPADPVERIFFPVARQAQRVVFGSEIWHVR
jgi:hypothetical protein